MAYKVGSTTVIDDSGNVPWSRITGAPAAGLTAGEYTKTATETQTQGSGNIVSTSYKGIEFMSNLTYHDVNVTTYSNCNCVSNCNCNCYC
jgi:hypothetical protein